MIRCANIFIYDNSIDFGPEEEMKMLMETIKDIINPSQVSPRSILM
jgi:hypothetical protein